MTDPVDKNQDDQSLGFHPQTPSSPEGVAAVESVPTQVEKASETASEIKKAPEAQKVPEVPTSKPSVQHSADESGAEPAASVESAVDDSVERVVDMRTGSSKLDEVKSKQPLTERADEEEEEFIEGVEHCHATGTTK